MVSAVFDVYILIRNPVSLDLITFTVLLLCNTQLQQVGWLCAINRFICSIHRSGVRSTHHMTGTIRLSSTIIVFLSIILSVVMAMVYVHKKSLTDDKLCSTAGHCFHVT